MSRVAAHPTLAEFASDIGTDGAVVVEGARTRWSLGGAPSPEARVVRAPVGIVDHRPEEMTVRVLAGTTVCDLHETLAAAGQRTALDERGGTVGGAIAAGENHVEVLGRGRMRSSVLEVTYVSADGVLVTGGGPTVKNVTGFDLPRLMTGSLGTLGAFGEFVLRTNPIPERRAWFTGEVADPFALFDELLRPSALLWNGVRCWALLEGHPADVELQRGLLGRHGSWDEVDAAPARPGLRWSTTPGAVRSLGTAAHGEFVASIGVGTVWSQRPGLRRRVDDRMRRLHEDVKAQFDPFGRLNPGRTPWEE